MSNTTQTFRGKAIPDTSGDPLFLEAQTLTTPGIEQILITHTVAVGKKVNLLQCYVSCRMEAAFKVKIDSNVVGSGRTGPGNLNAFFDWKPFREAAEGETIEIRFAEISGKPVTDVEAYLQAREIPT